MLCPIARDTSRYLSALDRDIAAEEREWREMDPELRSLAETPEGMGLVKEEEE